METGKLNRRNWLKTGLLTAGGITLFPHLGISEVPKTYIPLDAKGNALYSPFFKEFVPKEFPEESKLLAKLNANENPYGPSPKAVEALNNVATKGNRYAWRELFDLVDKIAAEEGVSPKNIMMGPGSSDLLGKNRYDPFPKWRQRCFGRSILYVLNAGSTSNRGQLEACSIKR
ncbi:hypothetical protein NYZ99_18955 [Maribacter litopenaei]|uniref:Uncharacterized protein n=1 Tax=Maribacter litopenaei TaxID=2976127 RepID=A0ABY5Y714_9FLAO|nr:hypothetical protein [Maribacter litopenaei]UWX54823.1 hypothetical protein NYZ99_18955 [Maribacter litopenaei]